MIVGNKTAKFGHSKLLHRWSFIKIVFYSCTQVELIALIYTLQAGLKRPQGLQEYRGWCEIIRRYDGEILGTFWTPCAPLNTPLIFTELKMGQPSEHFTTKFYWLATAICVLLCFIVVQFYLVREFIIKIGIGFLSEGVLCDGEESLFNVDRFFGGCLKVRNVILVLTPLLSPFSWNLGEDIGLECAQIRECVIISKITYQASRFLNVITSWSHSGWKIKYCVTWQED